jgi:hypothetical protein
MNDKETKQYLFAQRQHIAILAMLVIEFILGVTLGTLAPYTPHKSSTAHSIILDIHIGIGVLLIGAGITRLVLAYRWHPNVRLAAVLGLVSIIGAFTSGEAAIHGGGDTAVFLMAMFFITAIICYGVSLMGLRKTSSTSHGLS